MLFRLKQISPVTGDVETENPNIFPDELNAVILEQARKATACENAMGKWVAFKMFSPGVAFAMSMSLACVMEGYGLVLIAGFFGSPQFKKDFGCPTSSPGEEKCEIPAPWQSGLINGAQVGMIIGILFNGYLTDRIGFHKTFLGAVLAISAFISVTFIAPNLPILLLGLALCGLPWGVFQTSATAYASDVCPTPIRAIFTMWTNQCWVIGQLLGAVVQRVLISNQTALNYRLPLGLQWVFPIIIIAAVFRAPESPWWLVRQGRTRDARRALVKLTNMKYAPEGYSIDNQVAMLYVTNKIELADKANGGGKMGYLDCFGGVNLRRTTNCCLIWVMQNACGAALMHFSPYFFLQAGLGEQWAYTFTLIQYGVAMIGTSISWILVTKIGRRTLYLNGMILLFVLLVTIGTTSVLPTDQTTRGLAAGSLLLVFTFIYNCTVGPITYSLVSELPSTRLKSKTINLARASYSLEGLFNGAVTPAMLNPQSANWGAKTAWFWAGVSLLCVGYTYFGVPEPKDLTFGQIDELYAMKISARRFRAQGHILRARALVENFDMQELAPEEVSAPPGSAVLAMGDGETKGEARSSSGSVEKIS